ncbi:MAG: DUF63 family protein [Theionarchaea archaeon]|nr:DUF63 family protein [Theionarchaea archaeon]
MIPEFIQEYYIDPIKYGEGYNWVNTLTYGIILIIASILIYRYLQSRVDMDRKFYLSVSSFVLVGGAARVLKDMEVSESYILVTPLIYFLVFFITICSLIITLKIWKEQYYLYLSGVGIALFAGICILLFINAETYNYTALVYILLTTIGSTVLVYGGARLLHIGSVVQNIEIMGGHLLDASATSFGLALYGYFEQHMVPSFFIELAGTPFVMFPLKIAVVGLALRGVEDVQEESYKNFLKLIILILGAAPGLRDILRIFFMT